MRLRLLAPALLVTCLSIPAIAADAVAEVRVIDGKVLLDHWARTPIGRTWADPALDPVRKHWVEAQQKIATEAGFSPTDLIAALTDQRAALLPGSDPAKPVVVVQAGLGALAEKAMATIRKSDESKPTDVPGAAEAVTGNEPNVILARFAQHLVLAVNQLPVKPVPLGMPSADVVGRIDVAQTVDLFVPLLLEHSKESGAQMRDTLERLKKQVQDQGLGEASYRMELLDEGVLEHLDVVMTKPNPGTLPVDRALLARLPANTLMAAGFGIDYGAVWKTQRADLLAGWAPAMGIDPKNPDEVEKTINGKLAEQGLPYTAAELAEGMKGTFAIGLTPGMPAPGVTVILPRTPVLDGLMAWLGGKAGFEAPAEGSSVLVPLPSPAAPPVTLVCDKASWVASTDAILADAWLAGSSSGWATTPAMKTALQKAPKDAYLIGASDTPAVVRTLQTYAAMLLNFAKDLDRPTKGAIQQSLVKLAGNASTGYVVAGFDDGGKRGVAEIRSLTGLLPMPVAGGVIAAVMAGNRKKTAQDEPVAIIEEPPAEVRGPRSVLKSQVFPALVQFQAAAYVDQDGDGVGEYGFLSEMAGRRSVPSQRQRLALLGDTGLGKRDTVDGYRFSIFLPDGKGGVVNEPGAGQPRLIQAGAADWQETWFLAYAWPQRGTEGTMYCLLPNGAVYQAPFTGTKPAWDAVFNGGKAWGKPAWEPARSDATPVESTGGEGATAVP